MTIRTALIAAFATLTIAGAAAAQSTGSVVVKGNVPLNCTVAVTDLNQSLNLNGGETDKQVGSIVENCNSGTGYNISLSSSNAGQLKNSLGNLIGYTVKYDGNGGNLGSALQVTRATAQFGKTSPLAVSLNGSAQYIAGDYADTVTITIAAK
jgi:spore coat protein U-like protein